MKPLQEHYSKTNYSKNADEVAIPRILWALGAATASKLAPECTITSRKKKDIPFLDKARITDGVY